MTKKEKMVALKEQGAFNRQSDKIKDPLFQSNAFFDPHDLVQVKYEMVRQVTHDGKTISESSVLFGMSRPSFYQAQAALERDGILGLAPKKPGPKNRHKITKEILIFIEDHLALDGTIGLVKIVELVQEKFSVTLHPRSIARALDSKKKAL